MLGNLNGHWDTILNFYVGLKRTGKGGQSEATSFLQSV